MKKLMIVGASVLQLPAILKAKEMGLHVAVVDFNPQAIGIPYADEYYNASTMDEDAVLAAAEKYQPDGIMTLATDMPMRGVAKTSDKLHLHSISYETAVKATDKYDMIKAFKEHNVPSPWYFVVDTLDELKAHMADVTFPCIIKPTDNAGSHGVAKVYSFQELLENYEYAHSCSRHGKVIVEEYLDGPEVSVEVMVVNGEVNILQITDKITTEAPHFVEMGHTQPSRFQDDVQTAIRNVTVAACKAIGIDKGPAHVEMKVTNRGPVMIELGARMGGDNITTHLVPLSTGIDMVGSTIKVALGEEPDIEPTLHCGSAIRYFEVPFGTIKAIEHVEEAQRVPGVKQITFTKNVGEESTPIHCSNDRIGFVIAQGANAEDAVMACEEAMKVINVIIV
jgi:biotin carboxylase